MVSCSCFTGTEKNTRRFTLAVWPYLFFNVFFFLLSLNYFFSCLKNRLWKCLRSKHLEEKKHHHQSIICSNSQPLKMQKSDTCDPSILSFKRQFNITYANVWHTRLLILFVLPEHRLFCFVLGSVAFDTKGHTHFFIFIRLLLLFLFFF